MKKLLLVTLLIGIFGIFGSCKKSSNNNVTPTPTPTPTYANVYVSNYYIDPYNSYQLDVFCTNNGNATAYNVNVKIYTYSGSYYNYYYLTAYSIAPGQTVSGTVNCSAYYPYVFYYTPPTVTWN